MAIWSDLVALFLILSIMAFLALTMACMRPKLFPKLSSRRPLSYLALTALLSYLLMAIGLTLQDPLLWRYDRYGPTATIHRIPGYFPARHTRPVH